MEKTSFLSLTLALTVLTLGLGELVHVNSVLAVFCAGISFDQVVGGSDRAEEENIQESVNQFFTIPIFALFGLHLPWDMWGLWGWQAVLLTLMIIIFRRFPVMLALKKSIPAIKSYKEAAFIGWFGPVGVAAFFYSALVLKKTLFVEVWGVVSLIIFTSIIVHGLTGAFLTKRYENHR